MIGLAAWVQASQQAAPQGKERFTKDQLAHALEACRGLLSPTARRLHCDEKTVRNYLERYPELRAIAQEARASLVDIAEVQLAKDVKAGLFKAYRLVLITLGKDRGYTVRKEVTGANGAPISVSHELDALRKLSPEELVRLYRESLGQAAANR